MSIVVPFNFSVDSTTVKTNTTNEAVAAGKYALVYANTRAGGTFFIDDVAALTGQQSATDILFAASGAGTITYTVNGNAFFEGQIFATTPASALVDIDNSGTTIALGDSSTPIKLGPGQEIDITGTTDKKLVGVERAKDIGDQDGFFWVPTGTDLRVSGAASYVLMVFNEIT